MLLGLGFATLVAPQNDMPCIQAKPELCVCVCRLEFARIGGKVLKHSSKTTGPQWGDFRKSGTNFEVASSMGIL